ncbi:sporulation protein YqfD [Gracilibacillus sp. YIM 98692]|uniref:sporulation protein YqfD n=1 Tax=Gracilibacillus sp. YIM 98692 TaxID=2663532 RepID=UPI0013D38558|nr:sporulation protein YqfD [Gracilibacillus sp. YIM 98692]
MSFKKQNWFTGALTIRVKGEYPELFFNLCVKNGMDVWDIVKEDRTTCKGKINIADLSKLRQVKRKTIYKISFVSKSGFPFLIKKLKYRKPLLFGFFLGLLFIFFLSNIVWRVEVEGLEEELERQVYTKLEDYGVYRGGFQWNIESPAEIQKKLLQDIPELLWVGVKKQGASYHLEGVEKITVDKEEELPPSHLVARKEGVIEKVYVSNGQPLVTENQVVQKGDILVSGYLVNQEAITEDEDEEKEQTHKPVAAEGEVIAKVWYRSEIALPLEESYQVLSGNVMDKYYLRISRYLIPIWNWGKPEYSKFQLDTEERFLYFLKWKLPLSFIKQSISEKEEVTEKRTLEEAKQLALQQAKRNLKKEIPLDAEITKEKLLHEREENGKVKLTLYYTVLEDITKRQPINQGD